MAKILLIDSDRASRQILEHAFMLYEHDVVSTKQGDEGLTLAVTESPDLIVMDVDAQGVNGWQAIKILKESSATWSIPVIAMAAPNVSGQMLLQTGFDTYERKPATARHVLQKIDALLVKNATIHPPSAFHPPSASRNQEKAIKAHSPLSRTNVVYVSDDMADSYTMAAIVQGAGYSYANISDALQVLPKLIEHSPRLIFLELALPVANGYELCAQVRRISIFKNTPIIIVSNNERLADRVRGKMVGASGFVSKPIKAKQVLNFLIKYLSASTRVR